MKKINTINFVTGETGTCLIDEFFFNHLESEINGCKSTIETFPDIGIAKDGSCFAKQKILESLEKKANRLTSKELIFTTFYEDILDDIDAIKAIYDDNDEVSVKNVLLGQKIGYEYVACLIKRLNDAEEATE